MNKKVYLRSPISGWILFSSVFFLGFSGMNAVHAQTPDNPMPTPVENTAPPPMSQDLAPPALLENEGAEDVDENLFFDAESLVPKGEMGSRATARKVNPLLEPGSKLIVVKKGASASSYTANITAAERAMKLGRYESALAIYDKLYAQNKRDPNILMGRARALQKSGQTSEAIQTYEELLALRPNNVEASVNMIGLMSKSFPAVALRHLADLYDKHPNDIGVIAQLSVVNAELGNYEDAVRYLGMAAGLEPNNASHLYNMAVISDRAGKKSQAVRYYEEALETDTVYGGGRTIPRDRIFERLAQLR